MEFEDIRREIVDIGKKLVERRLTYGTCGNISCRAPDGRRMLITPSGIPYEMIKPEDILILNFHGEIEKGDLRPSVETPFHLAIYRRRGDVNAVIHIHSQYTLAVSAVSDFVPVFLDEIFSHIGGDLQVSRYALPGSAELAKNVIEALGDRNAALLSNHGAVCCGRNLKEAFEIAEIVEEICKIFILSSSLGEIKILPDEGRKYQREMFEMKKT
ncbi:MAG: class II aldolase/adducin family protein [Thermoplasmata archaeon]|nr:MAG: class II aldolase/adducin family protein [Thermoplasmata archaeon]